MIGLGLNIRKSIGLSEKLSKILVADFKARVLADSGVFEAEGCLRKQLKKLL